MTHHLLIWTLALMLSAPLLTAGDDPEDPYQWLEEVLGREAAGLGQGAECREHERADSVRRVPRARASHSRDPRLRRSHPGHPEDRPVLLQLLARRQEPARALAAHHARRVPQGQAQLGGRARSRRSSARKRRKTGSGTAPRRSSPSTSWPWFRSRAGAPTRAWCANST